ncbi:hypothetical protein ACFZAG_36405 [Streptomyces sp. NPDC012403]|uniref:hypothetical protein n=1 Tax=unclassified Streptomyces TaxID=2593676 RepID=UPI001C22C002|nr:hypothetical protein [Streptomyces sp. AC558_RSS880]
MPGPSFGSVVAHIDACGKTTLPDGFTRRSSTEKIVPDGLPGPSGRTRHAVRASRSPQSSRPS